MSFLSTPLLLKFKSRSRKQQMILERLQSTVSSLHSCSQFFYMIFLKM